MKQTKIPFASKVDTITHKGLAEMVFVLWGKHDRLMKFLKRHQGRLTDLDRDLKKVRLNTLENNTEIQDLIGNIDFVTRGLTSLEGDFFAFIGEPAEGDENNIHPISEEETQEKIEKLADELKKEENKTEEIEKTVSKQTQESMCDRYFDRYDGGYEGKYGYQSPLLSSKSANEVKKICTIQIDKQNKATKKESVLKK